MAFPPAFDRTFDETFPPDTQLANLLGQDIRNLKTDIRERMALLSGTLANRPSNMDAAFGGAGYGALFFATDTKQIFQWNGAVWVDVTSSIASTTATALATTGASVVVSGAAPPTAGQVLMATSPTVAAWQGSLKFEGSNIVPVTVTNTVALTNLQTIAIAANEIGAGQAFHVDALGTESCTNTGDTLLVGVYLDAVQLGYGTWSCNGATGQAWRFHALFAGLTVGAGGTVIGAYIDWYCSPSVGGIGGNGTMTSVTTNAGGGTGAPQQAIVVDTTAPHVLALKAQWGVARATNVITSNYMNCVRLG